MNASIPETLLEKVRKLLAKAEDDATTTAEAEALTAKAAELMAKYGIEQAMLGDAHPGQDTPSNRIVSCSAPWALECARLLAGLATAMRCQAIRLPKTGSDVKVHLFGYASDLERVEVLYTSLLLQMTTGLARQPVPPGVTPRSYRRSWIGGFQIAVVRRVQEAERRAEDAAASETSASGRGGELVLADRRAVIQREYDDAHPNRRSSRATYRGNGVKAGQAAGLRANIGGKGVSGSRRAIGGTR